VEPPDPNKLAEEASINHQRQFGCKGMAQIAVAWPESQISAPRRSICWVQNVWSPNPWSS